MGIHFVELNLFAKFCLYFDEISFGVDII